MLVPNLVGRLLSEGICSVEVMQSEDVWHGMTYKEDKPEVVAAIRELIDRANTRRGSGSNFPGYIA